MSRKAILAHLSRYPGSQLTAYELARVLGLPVKTTKKACEDLWASGKLWRYDKLDQPPRISWQLAGALPVLDKRQGCC